MPISNDNGVFENELQTIAAQYGLESPTESAGALKSEEGTQTASENTSLYGLPNGFEGGVDWSKLNQSFGSIKSTSKEDTPIIAKTPSGMVITEGDINEAINVGMGAGPASIIGRGAILPEGAAMSLGKAMSARAFKEDPAVTLRNTGWYKGPDDKWRYEISDLGMKLKERDWTPGQKGRLEDFVEHNELYSAYPELRSYKFEIAPANYRSIASVNPRTKTILVNPAKIESGEQGLLDVLAHEIQHTIQLKEGFALGGGTQQALAQATTALVEKMKATKDPEAKKEMMDLFLSIHGDADNFAHYMYTRLPGEVEANSVAARRLLTDAQRKEFPVKEMEKMLEGSENRAIGSSYVTDFIYPK